jgi:23S rRNA pseudouridine1911/1915/1917 synthase
MSVIKGLPPVLFEDDSLIAFDKPSGLLVAPDRWDKDRENLMDSIHKKFSPDCFNAHRLDRDTSGILLCAKNKTVLKPLCSLFESHAMTKEYIAIVFGAPTGDQGVIDLALDDDPRQPGRMKVDRHGKTANTEFEVIQRWRGYAQVRLRPLTGRTHQLRVHMAAVGCPILSDVMYGNGRSLYLSRIKPGYKFKANEDERPLIRRLALHAAVLRFRHPVTESDVEITAPLPHEFTVGIKYLDRFASVAGSSPANPA